MLKRSLSFFIFILIAFLAYLVFNAITFRSKQVQHEPVVKIQIHDSVTHHLAAAIRHKTISYENHEEIDASHFLAFGQFVHDTYPLVNLHLERKIINEHSILYTWKGTDDSLAPAVLVAHLDVVPVAEEDMDNWTFPPFNGVIDDGMIWGRGALDDKVSVIGILEAVEYLLGENFTPQRTIYLAFGHDEEIGGLNGAKAIAEQLKMDGVAPEFVLDEGFAVTQGLVPGVLTDVALIGISEKGFASIKLKAEIDGGHSSMPATESAIQVIASAITKLQNNPFPSQITQPVQQFLKYVGPEMRFQEKIVFANSSLFESVIKSIYRQTAPGRAVVTTTMAPTIFNSGVKDNVIPSVATATINFRILPGTTIADVVTYVKNTINDPRITIDLGEFYSEPGKVSSTQSKGYGIVNRSIKEIFPEVIIVPNLVLAATDGRHYSNICDNIYRFLPIRLNPDNINTMHGIDERLPVEDFKDVIRFYIQLIRNCG
jgi:carboxypeptidase PM20D1